MKIFVLIVLVIVFLFSFNIMAIASQSIAVPELDLSIDIPDDYMVFTRNISPISDIALQLEEYGVPLEEVLAAMETQHLYLDAISDDGLTEISLISNDVENSPELKNLDESTIEGLIEALSSGDAIEDFSNESNAVMLDNIQTEEFEKEMINNVLYITYNLTGKQNDVEIYSRNYFTITRNHALTIRFMSYNEITPSQNKIIDNIVHSITFLAPESTVQSNDTSFSWDELLYKVLIGAIVAGIIGGIAGPIAWHKNKKKKANMSEETTNENVNNEQKKIIIQLEKEQHSEDQIVKTQIKSEQVDQKGINNNVQINEIPKDEEKLFCKECGSKIPVDSKFCYKCGTKVNQ